MVSPPYNTYSKINAYIVIHTITILNPAVPQTITDHKRSGNDLSDEKHNSINHDMIITIKYNFNNAIMFHLPKNVVKLIRHKQNKTR